MFKFSSIFDIFLINIVISKKLRMQRIMQYFGQSLIGLSPRDEEKKAAGISLFCACVDRDIIFFATFMHNISTSAASTSIVLVGVLVHGVVLFAIMDLDPICGS